MPSLAPRLPAARPHQLGLPRQQHTGRAWHPAAGAPQPSLPPAAIVPLPPPAGGLPTLWDPPPLLLLCPPQDVLVVEHQRPWPGSDGAASPSCGGLARGSSGDASDAPSLARCSACGSAAEQYSLFAVFDGHNGASAARLAAKEVVPVLEERLPQGAPPPPHSPQYTPWCAR